MRNLLWMLALFGTLGALLVFSTQLPLLEVATLVGICVSVSAALVTVVALWEDTEGTTEGITEGTTPDKAGFGGHNYAGPRPDGSGDGSGSGGWHGGSWDGPWDGPWDGDGGGGGGQ